MYNIVNHFLDIKIIEDLLELMFRCTFVMPVKKLSHALSQEDTVASTTESMATFAVDDKHWSHVEYSPRGADDDGMSVHYDCTKPGFVLGTIPLTDGKCTWKVQD